MESNLNSVMEKYKEADHTDQAKMKGWKDLIIQEINKKKVSDNPAIKSLIYALNKDIVSINKALLNEEKMTEETRAGLFLRRKWSEETLKPFVQNSKVMEALDIEIRKALDARN